MGEWKKRSWLLLERKKVVNCQDKNQTKIKVKSQKRGRGGGKRGKNKRQRLRSKRKRNLCGSLSSIKKQEERSNR